MKTKSRLSKQEYRELNMSLELLKTQSDQDRHKIFLMQLEQMSTMLNTEIKYDIILCMLDSRYTEKYANLESVQKYFYAHLNDVLDTFSGRNCILFVSSKFMYLNYLLTTIADDWKIHPELVHYHTSSILGEDSINKYPSNNSVDILIATKGYMKFKYDLNLGINSASYYTIVPSIIHSIVSKGMNVLDLWPTPNSILTINNCGGYSTSICYHERQFNMCKQQQYSIALGG